MAQQLSEPLRLKVLIVGPGIGGLTAAIALGRQGHDVQLFERSDGPSEVGAAINICYNADSVLKHLGVDVAESGGVLMDNLRLLKASGEVLSDEDFGANAHRWQSDYRMTLRAHLHGHLRSVATSPNGIGSPARIEYSSKVTAVDARTAAVIFADGTSINGDLLVGADGVGSVARSQVDPNMRAKPGRHSAFRFLVSEDEVLADLKTAELLSTRNCMWMWYSSDRKIVMYRCENNKLLNFVCIHPEHLSSAVAHSYNTVADKGLLLDIFSDFEPGLRAVLEKADPDSLRVYPLFDMDTLPTFTTGRMALLGDAAHPFLPHLAQGGAQAIEDGVSLGVMMSGVSSLDEIPARLGLYDDARHERATLIQKYTRLVGGDGIKQEQTSGDSLSVHQYMQYPYSHDEQHASTAILRRHLWSQKPSLYWRQPTAFGPMPGPRQDISGKARPGLDRVRCTTAKIVFTTSATMLRNLLPYSGFSFKSSDTVATAGIKLQMPKGLAWLGGGGYSLLGLYIHSVIYSAKDGREYTGACLPVMFENHADPIVSGREELGFPKVFTDIETQTDQNTLKASLSWGGAKWAEFVWPLSDEDHECGEDQGVRLVDAESLLVARRMPGVGDQAKTAPDGDYAAYCPSKKAGMKLLSERICHKPANLSFKSHGWEKLPTLQHIAEGFEELPIFAVVESSVVETEGWTNFDEIVRIDD